MYDLCIIGGGASGMACAITAARFGLSCVIFEKESKLGRKIYASGNGRCNVTNHNFQGGFSFYYNSSNSKYELFLNNLFNNDSPDKEVTEFLNSVGIVTYDIDNYVYPHSLQASSLMWALTDTIRNLKIDVKLNSCVDKIDDIDGIYKVYTKKDCIDALNLVFACGGAGYSSLGGSLKGYELLNKLNIKCTDLRPSLCGLISRDDVSTLSGVRVKATARLYDKNIYESINRIPEASESGELQFTEYGVSGIMIFNLSSKVGKMLSENKIPYVVFDFLPDINDEIVIKTFENSCYRKHKAVLNNFINDRLAGYIIENLSETTDIDIQNKDYVNNVIDQIHNFKLEIKALTDFNNAQVTSGGIALDCINPSDMSINERSGFYAVGEITDVDGICGGYNLTYAIISGIRAGKGIHDKIKSN